MGDGDPASFPSSVSCSNTTNNTNSPSSLPQASNSSGTSRFGSLLWSFMKRVATGGGLREKLAHKRSKKMRTDEEGTASGTEDALGVINKDRHTDNPGYLHSVRGKRKVPSIRPNRWKMYRFASASHSGPQFLRPATRRSEALKRGRRPFALDPLTSYEDDMLDNYDPAILQLRRGQEVEQEDEQEMGSSSTGHGYLIGLELSILSYQTVVVVHATDEQFAFAVLLLILVYHLRTRRTPIEAAPAEPFYLPFPIFS